MFTGTPLVRVMAALALSVALVTPVAAFNVSFNYYCYATGSDGIPIRDYDTLEGECFVTGDYTKTGEAGNLGTALFYADLSTATVSAFAHSHGVQNGPYSFALDRHRCVKTSVYDLAGSRVAVLVDESMPAGRHEVIWAGTDDSGRRMASGTYFCRMQAGGFIETTRMVLVK